MQYVSGRSSLVLCFLVHSIFFTVTAVAAEKKNEKFFPAIPVLLLSSHSGPVAHRSIREWNGTATCLTCHLEEAKQVFASSHYQWLGETPYMTNGPNLQGKLDLGVNSYCINITGNWNGCGACHVGLGLRPEPVETASQLANIDCLICHQEKYKRKKVAGRFVADEGNMTITMLSGPPRPCICRPG